MKVGALGGGCPWPCVLPLALGAARCVGLCSAGLGAAAMARLIQRYWDIPDGAECHRKAYASTSNTGALGLITSAYSVALQPPDSFLEGGASTGRYTFTAAAIGAVLGIASCVSARVRQKPDDPLNYFIGGCAGDLTLGARTHSYGIGAAACADMGIAGVVKMGQLEGWELFAEPKV